mmetsp:Transcript_8731/g.26462  ORF Transcript_8731/g.26462 Transcript_8731/m.26462 type:complete len:80 (-) Transcript_8731:258-497(-)
MWQRQRPAHFEQCSASDALMSRLPFQNCELLNGSTRAARGLGQHLRVSSNVWAGMGQEIQDWCDYKWLDYIGAASLDPI